MASELNLHDVSVSKLDLSSHQPRKVDKISRNQIKNELKTHMSKLFTMLKLVILDIKPRIQASNRLVLNSIKYSSRVSFDFY